MVNLLEIWEEAIEGDHLHSNQEVPIASKNMEIMRSRFMGSILMSMDPLGVQDISMKGS
jgi:hypothetical protein